MAIEKRGPGRWKVRVKGFPALVLPTRAAAELLEADYILKKKLGALHRPTPASLGAELDGALERKVAMGGRRGPLRPATVADYELARRFWAPLDTRPLRAVGRAHIEDHVAARAVEAPVAAAHALQFLKSALRDAASRGQTVDPAIFEIPPVGHEPIEGVALEPAMLDEICSFMPERIGRVVPFCGTVGLRFREAMTLTDDRVDIEARQIMIPRSLNKSRREKPVKLSPGEARLLAEQMMERPAGTNVVFPNASGGVYSKSGFRAVWLPALAASGLAVHAGRKSYVDVRFRFHWLRHTAISLMARAGMRPELIADRVGHSDGGALIYRRYRHLFPSEMAAAVELVDVLMGELAPREAVSV